MNYFELFEIPQRFDVDIAELSNRYRELQKTVHPDKFANAGEQQKLLAISKTAQVNDGYQTLKDPIRRAEHMLLLRGVDIDNESTTMKDSGFLMQQLEWREALAELRDSDNIDADIAALEAEFTQYRQQLLDNLSKQLVDTQASSAMLAADQVRKLKFMAKLQDELTRIQDAMYD
ncbi:MULTISPECIES: co-chaperone HscB [Shewanella]|uniref:co-chaperone HscB n=1 Tax=Shewanella TaxID=22 RepID=UPI001673176F|nr:MULTISPECIES: co-chaperone HscB [Shewanella]MBO1271459.1 co-chaperone HscB [Shewanella sp. 4t3-1-2LB]MCL2907666.1 co-chaperone HscB [Shewanella fodinae]GGY99844.1 co-chaperone protein HscB [Shewanella fodinae]